MRRGIVREGRTKAGIRDERAGSILLATTDAAITPPAFGYLYDYVSELEAKVAAAEATKDSLETHRLIRLASTALRAILQRHGDAEAIEFAEEIERKLSRRLAGKGTK
jgi:hypothetical protein